MMTFIKKYPALFAGLIVLLSFVFFWLIRLDAFDSIDLKFYDTMIKFKGVPGQSKDIVIVDIDNTSIEKLGRWPWPRSIIADGIDKISTGNPKVIGLNIILSEPEQNSGIEELNKLEAIFINQLFDAVGDQGASFLNSINDAKKNLDNDKKLANAIKDSGKVILPAFFKKSSIKKISQDKTDVKSPLNKHAVKNIRIPPGSECYTAGKITLPLKPLLQNARGLGHITIGLDVDGVVRKDPLLHHYRGMYIPSYTLKLAAIYLNIPDNKIRVNLGSAIYLGRRKIPTTALSELLICYKRSNAKEGPFKSYSYADVVNGKIPLNVFTDKIVLISTSASGVINPLNTPTNPAMTVGEFSAQSIWAILDKRFIHQPPWDYFTELLTIVLLGVLICFVLPKLKAIPSGIMLLVLFIAFLAGAIYLFMSKDLWIRITYPIAELFAGYLIVITVKYFTTETGKEQVELESAESSKMLGLSFQDKGMLDMAFSNFRKVPVDDEMKDIIYNLALDYERKRQFNKAAMVYRYIEQHDKKFKDVHSRIKRLMDASDKIVFGDTLPGSNRLADDLLASGTDTHPTLGRYELIKRLGKGAMGVVYLGVDPRIQRKTAIKTFKFAENFELEQVEKAKQDFFREAQSAGTLSHPNIVTIYDAGEDQDLAYIAMEYLEGHTLEKYTKKNNLLAMIKVIQLTADIADALDYAHRNGVVHRDIKPSNIMVDTSERVKITDFGIARIAAISKTQTGIVKGTPFYMSPEQFSGDKVDGRSDIFSLGVMMYQLLTGEHPFRGSSPAELMNNILNVRHPDPRKYNPKIIKPLVPVLDKAMEKDKNIRYQSADLLSSHLRELAKKIDELVARKKANAKRQ